MQKNAFIPIPNSSSMALITGASSGIGWEYAKLLACKGYDILMVSNQASILDEKSKVIETKYNVHAIPFYVDLTETSAAEKLFFFCQENNFTIDILINNAGIYFTGEICETEIQQIENMIRLHVITLSLLCRYFGAEMQHRKRGYILNMSSLSAWMPYPNIALYASTKRYIKAFSRSLRTELLPYNVSVSVMTPGAVNTPLLHLAPIYKTLALRFGVMLSPEKVATKALKIMFHRKARCTPGILNKLSIPFLLLAPNDLVAFIEKKLGKVFVK